MKTSSVRFIQYIFINDVQYMLTSSIFSSIVLKVSADYHLHLNERDHLIEFVKATWLKLRGGKPLSDSALPED